MSSVACLEVTRGQAKKQDLPKRLLHRGKRVSLLLVASFCHDVRGQ
jgi:hypothetical protein